MKRTLSVVILLLLLGAAAVLGTERYDRSRSEARVMAGVRQQFEGHVVRLREDLRALQALNGRLAAALAAAPGGEAGPFASIAPGMTQARPDIRSIVFVRKLRIEQVYPIAGNEPVIGLDYSLRPQFMAKIAYMIRHRVPVVDGSTRLVQTGRTGLIFRAPIFDAPDAAGGDGYRGMTALTVDLENTLRRAGLIGPEAAFDLAIRSREEGRPAYGLFGDMGLFDRPHVPATITLPDAAWELAAVPKNGLAYDPARAWLIRGVGATVTLILLLVVLYRRGVWRPRPGECIVRDGLASLRTLLLVATLAPMPLMVGLAGWMVFTVSIQAVEDLERQQVDELADQLRDKVVDFFEVPRTAATFNAGQFKSGLVGLGRREDLLRSFLLQLRQQPLLTLLSIGTADGGYLAAGRPPVGAERGLRILEAGPGGGGALRIDRVDDDNRRSTSAGIGNPHYDARVRPWFLAALQADSLRWYPAYHYAIHDPGGLFEDMGMGMSVALRDEAGHLAGVLTADVALSQISRFLRAEMVRIDGIAFLAESGGALLASSGGEPIYHLEGGQVRRVLADQSDTPEIRLLGARILHSGRVTGRQSLEFEGRRYSARWQSIQLPDGPMLTIALALPESRYAEPAERALNRVGLLILGFWVVGVAAALLAAWWLSRPLLSLSRWAEELAEGGGRFSPSVRSPVREIVVLAHALDRMADRQRSHARDLERQVAERTQALVQANQRLVGLSLTDGLTGLANRRHFDEVLAREGDRSRRDRRPMSLLMLDVDWFKHYNDQYGHPAGDVVLCQIARILLESVRRPGDLAARYGGEEFAVILPGLDVHAAEGMAERIRARVEALAITHAHGLSGRVTISVGVAEMDLDDAHGAETLVGRADAALYRAKAGGRNRVETAGATAGPEGPEAPAA
ncbi:diguanylate cyclase OS=Castellaniella defragrans (strain DSM / CCUG 39792 / 65Phen) OX=1437824 GN=BN940_01901 PE=4 SV=1 [Castellaniella denitrificans]|uniref:diguanylate cyclase n=1 Tax=Castellaniella sp. TaxID=1955812 RepID=UPI002AFE9E6D|nr:diguanylate cyclase [Castellaniella sp.]